MTFKLNGIQLKGNGGKKKTKYVTDKNSPDLKNYNDSLSWHNKGIRNSNAMLMSIKDYQRQSGSNEKLYKENVPANRGNSSGNTQYISGHTKYYQTEGHDPEKIDWSPKYHEGENYPKNMQPNSSDVFFNDKVKGTSRNMSKNFTQIKNNAGVVNTYHPTKDTPIGHTAKWKKPTQPVKYKIAKTASKPNNPKPTNKVKYADPKIVEKQKMLQKLGLYKGELDGIMGLKSQEALETYKSNMAKTVSKPNNPKPATKNTPATTTAPTKNTAAVTTTTTPNKPGQYTKSTQYPGVKHVYDKGTKRIVAWQNKKGKQVPFGTKFTKEFQYPK